MVRAIGGGMARAIGGGMVRAIGGGIVRGDMIPGGMTTAGTRAVVDLHRSLHDADPTVTNVAMDIMSTEDCVFASC